MAIEYKFVEVAPVTDDKLETTVNRWVSQGWAFDALHFAMRDGSHRPAMAFVAFVRDDGADEAAGDSPADAPEGASDAGVGDTQSSARTGATVRPIK